LSAWSTKELANPSVRIILDWVTPSTSGKTFPRKGRGREVERDVESLHVSSQIVRDGRGPLVEPPSHISVEVC
jgi:hypothetical protein